MKTNGTVPEGMHRVRMINDYDRMLETDHREYHRKKLKLSDTADKITPSAQCDPPRGHLTGEAVRNSYKREQFILSID